MDFDSLVISVLDSNAVKGCFIKELAKALNISTSHITDVWLETELVEGVVSQIIKVSFIDAEISKESLMELPFKSIYENTIIFEVGDIFL